ncbi:hypothetical protein ACQPYK_25360 [Streptosporangium sp. CA-135522]|uniref:hypothetical protein n=1 Tax=Streptosporangium sp. CA-135522 TaxID=3240072 RepID=UPI003D8E1C5C
MNELNISAEEHDRALHKRGITRGLWSERPSGKLITELKVNDRILVPRPKALGGQPQKGTVTSEPHRGSAPGMWGIDVTYDGPIGLDATLWREEDARFELDAPAKPDPKDERMPYPFLPELPGLTAVGEIDFFDGPAEADVTGVWRDDATGQLYYADDWVGSWPAPHADVTREDLTEITADELQVYLNKRLDDAEWMNGREPYVAEIAELMDRVRKP